MFHNAEYIYAVYKAGSFSAAAKDLYITQPCLSAMVKKKEEQLGVRIFDRNSKPLRLTEYGVQYINYLEQIQNLEQEYEKYLSDVRELRTGHLAIGANNVFASFVLPSIIRSFKSKYPNVQIQIVEGNITFLEEQLMQGKLDLLMGNYTLDDVFYETHHLTKTDRTSEDAVFVKHHLCTEQLLLAAHRSIQDADPLSDHYFNHDDILAGRHMNGDASVFFPDALAKAPVIALRGGNDTRLRLDSLFHQAGRSSNIQLAVDQLATAYNIACTGVGVTLVSDTLLYNMPPQPNMCYYKLPKKISTRGINMYHKRSRYIHVAMQKFMDMAISVLYDGIIKY